MNKYSIVKEYEYDENEKYPVYFAFLSLLEDPKLHNTFVKGIRYRLTSFGLKYFVGRGDSMIPLNHVDIIIGKFSYGPKQSIGLREEERKFQTGQRTYIRIMLNEKDFDTTIRFLRNEANKNPGFDYCGFLNFIPFCPCYCFPLNCGSEFFGNNKKWFCSNFAATLIQKLDKFKYSQNEIVKKFMRMNTSTTNPEDIKTVINQVGSTVNSINFTKDEEDLINEANFTKDEEDLINEAYYKISKEITY